MPGVLRGGGDKYEAPITVVPKSEVNNLETETTPIVNQIFTNRILQAELVGRADEIKKLQRAYTSIREVLALWLNPLRRRTAHRQIAQVIETRYASRLEIFYSKLAYHHQMAEQTTKAVEYLLKVADGATSVYAFVEAASFMEKAVELLLGEENRPQRAELLRKLSVDVYLYIGKPDKAIKAGIAACTLWQELGDSVKEAEGRLDVSFSFHWMGQETDAIEYIKRALSCLVSAPQETRLLAKVHVQWGLSATASGNIPKALEQLQLADELHTQIGGNDPFIAVVSLWARSWCAFASGTLQQMLDYALQSAALCRHICMFAWEPMMTVLNPPQAARFQPLADRRVSGGL